MKNIFIYTSFLLITVFAMFGANSFKSNSQQTITKKDKIKKDTLDANIKMMAKGQPFITNFSFENRHFLSNRFVVQDGSGNMIFSNERGILVFNGNEEKEYFFSREITSLKKDTVSQIVFAGNLNGFSVVESKGASVYSLNEIFNNDSLNDSFDNIIFFENRAWFIGEKYIYSVAIDDLTNVREEFKSETSSIQGVVNNRERLYVITADEKPFDLISKKTKAITNYKSISTSKILFTATFGTQIILGNADNKLYLFDGAGFYRYKISTQEYINESVIVGGLALNKKEFVLYTLNGGALVVDKEDRDTRATINYRTGLPQDEIYSAAIDNEGALWLTHESGASRVALNIALKDYGGYPGLEGQINNIIEHDNTLYLSTGEGVFYLSQIKDYKEIEKIVRIKKKETSKNDNRSAFSKFFRKKIKKVRNGINRKSTSYVKKAYELQSIKFSYKKVANVNAKCQKMIGFNGGLLVASNAGLYYLKNDESTLLIPDVYINDLVKVDSTFIVATNQGLYKIIISDKTKPEIDEELISEFLKIPEIGDNEIFNIAYNKNTLWCGSINKVLKLKVDDNINYTYDKTFDINLDFSEKVLVKQVNGRMLFITGENIYEYKNNEIHLDTELSIKNTYSSYIFFPDKNSLLITKRGKIEYTYNLKEKNENSKYLNLFKNFNKLIFDDKKNVWIITEDNKLYKIEDKVENKYLYKLKIDNVEGSKNQKLDFSKVINLNYDDSYIKINLSAPHFIKKDGINYYFSVDEENLEAFINSKESEIKIYQLKNKGHIIRFFAENSLGERTQVEQIYIFIKPPFWETSIFLFVTFIFIVILIFVLSAMLNKRKQRKIKRRNEELENEVELRTSKIKLQKEEIMAQNDEILYINEKISKQNTEITDSINYASKIQRAMLSNHDVLQKYMSEYFIYYKPRDIVSGDFYWFKESKNKLYVVAADCTGHGVPGGFLSMLGISSLNDIVNLSELSNIEFSAAQILDDLRTKVISSLDISEGYNANDGMDIALIVIDKQNMKIEFSGANNPIIIISEDELSEIRGDRMHIGLSRKKDVPFTNSSFDVKKGDKIYLFSDGYLDQFGGERDRKFTKKRLKSLLIEIKEMNFKEQNKVVKEVFEKWKSHTDQIDDVILMGVKI